MKNWYERLILMSLKINIPYKYKKVWENEHLYSKSVFAVELERNNRHGLPGSHDKNVLPSKK